MASLTLEIVTPEGRKLREQVDELTAPSVAGEFGVLPGHLPILAALRTGILSWRKGSTTGSCAVGWGFIEVSHDHAYVLTDRYASKESLDPVAIRANLKILDSKIDKYPGKTTDQEYEALVYEELWCAAQLELHGDPPPPTIAFVSPYGRAPETEGGLTDDVPEAPPIREE
ncbi:MAG: ATP synthase F1 subunit epsilon [Myxococcales bacterium]|nr:ATP synthase F1 subunit epsilon [Polyangiaceae bacterium]MDW8248897.1 ATP synthase F1 subunit epsilon [Myxococcales bacterium]